MFEIRKATLADLPSIVDVHLKAFKGFFLSRMGSRFLTTYYSLVLEYKHGILLVAEDDKTIVGFASGFVYPDEFYQLTKASKKRFIFPAMVGFLRDIRLLPRFIANTRRVESGEPIAAPGVIIPCELSSIGIDPNRRGKGQGKALLIAFESSAQTSGADGISLTTDADGNDYVNKFYESQGYTLESTFNSSGDRRMNKYVKPLNSGNEVR